MKVQVTVYLNGFMSNWKELPGFAAGGPGMYGIPMFDFAAKKAEHCDPYDYSGVEATVTGVTCGHCSGDWGQVRHLTVAHVKACAAHGRAMEEEAAIEAPLIRAGWL